MIWLCYEKTQAELRKEEAMKQVINITPEQKQKEKIRLAAYCRVSSNSQEQRHSFATQIRYYGEYTKRHPEYELVDIYADEGLTGTEMSKRDDLLRLLNDCSEGKVDQIIVKSISRFARNTEELLETIRALRSIGVSVYFEEQGIDTKKLNSEMFVTLPGMVAQKESEAISGNLRWGIRKRMAEGTFKCSSAAYGYMRIDGELVINEVEAVTVRRIFQLYLQGMGKQSIANLLNSEGVPKREEGQIWTMRAIQYILTNERYKGDSLLQKQYTTDQIPFKRKTNHGEKAMYNVEGTNAPIIDDVTYQAVQDLVKMRRVEQRVQEYHALSKKIRCPDCGKYFRRRMVRGKAYWCCSLMDAQGSQCKSRRVKEEMVYDAFTNMAYKLQANRKYILETLIDGLDRLQRQGGENREGIQKIDKELADLSAKKLFITRLHTSGVLTTGDYLSQTSEIGNKMAELRRERKKLLAADESDVMLDGLRKLNETLEEYRPNGRFCMELFEQIVENIAVSDNNELIFALIGGVAFTEKIKEKGWCKRS